MTKKQYNKAVMPPINIYIENKYKILYINYGKLRFTASYKDISPEIGKELIWDNIVYKVSYINEKEKRFSAVMLRIITPEVEEKSSSDVATLI